MTIPEPTSLLRLPAAAPDAVAGLFDGEAPPPEMDDAERCRRLAHLLAAEREATRRRSLDARLWALTSRPEPERDVAAALARLDGPRMRRDAWTAVLDARVRFLRDAGWTTAAIADEVGRTPAAVRYRIEALRLSGVDVPRKAPGGHPGSLGQFYSDDDDACIRRMAAEGASWAAIGRAVGRSGDAVRIRCARLRGGA